MRGPNNVGRAVQIDPTFLRYASAITEHGTRITGHGTRDHGTTELLAVVASKVSPVSNFVQQLPTTRNYMQEGVQTDATCNTQQRWELLANRTMLRPFARILISCSTNCGELFNFHFRLFRSSNIRKFIYSKNITS